MCVLAVLSASEQGRRAAEVVGVHSSLHIHIGMSIVILLAETAQVVEITISPCASADWPRRK